ncbi:MAG TPA: Holliday junction resolvase RuvX, partial [Candidatus Saccharimonadales bacterium]|nr:Holliday junction resolvase RuvX [Candidatus Saccharimonadales bacterium]
ERRIGVARADLNVGIASPLVTIEQSDHTMDDILKILGEHEATVVIVGLPRGMDGQETAQTRTVRDFADLLKAQITVELVLQDEALTSKLAEAELEKRGKPFKKSDIDALAATYILDDYISAHKTKAPH